MADKAAAKPPTVLDWWVTLPGVLTATAGVITALAGLLVVLPQLRAGGDAARPPAPLSASAAATTAPAAAAAPAVRAQPGAVSSAPAAGAPGQPVAPAAQRPVDLPAGMEQHFALEDVVYTVLAARLEPLTAQHNYLRLTIRCALGSGPATGFWSDSFRLLVDSVPRAPVNFLNSSVDARSAKEGEVLFEVPVGAATADLQITSAKTGHPYRTGANIPINLKPSYRSSENVLD